MKVVIILAVLGFTLNDICAQNNMEIRDGDLGIFSDQKRTIRLRPSGVINISDTITTRPIFNDKFLTLGADRMSLRETFNLSTADALNMTTGAIELRRESIFGVEQAPYLHLETSYNNVRQGNIEIFRGNGDLSIQMFGQEGSQDGGQIDLYESNAKTISLDGDFSNYGSIQAINYMPSQTMFDASTTNLGSSQAYAMLRFETRNRAAGFLNYAWNFGTFAGALEFNGQSSVFDFADHSNPLTFAYTDFSGDTKYVRVIEPDGSDHTASDMRLKKNIDSIVDGLEVVGKLKPKNYNWKNSESDELAFGFLAQDVRKVIPELVLELSNPDDDETTLLLDYQGLIPFLTAAVQEQQGIIESQEQKLTEINLFMKKQEKLNAELLSLLNNKGDE